MKGQKQNMQDKKKRLERSNTRSNSPKSEASQGISPKRAQSHHGAIIPVMLGLFSSNSPKRAQSRPRREVT